MKVLKYVTAAIIFIAIIALGVIVVMECIDSYNTGVIDRELFITCVFGYVTIVLMLVAFVIAIIVD